MSLFKAWTHSKEIAELHWVDHFVNAIYVPAMGSCCKVCFHQCITWRTCLPFSRHSSWSSCQRNCYLHIHDSLSQDVLCQSFPSVLQVLQSHKSEQVLNIFKLLIIIVNEWVKSKTHSWDMSAHRTVQSWLSESSWHIDWLTSAVQHKGMSLHAGQSVKSKPKFFWLNKFYLGIINL